MSIPFDTRQSVQRSNLKNLGKTSGSRLDGIVSNINTELDSPLKMYATFPAADAKLNFSDAQVTSADGTKKVVSPISNQVFSSLSSLWIDFQTQAVSNAANFDIIWPVGSTVGKFRSAGISLTDSGKINVLFSSEETSESALPDAGTLMASGGLPLGYIILECTNSLGYFKTAGSSTSIIENTKIYRFGAGSGGGGGSGANNKVIFSSRVLADGSSADNCSLAVVSNKTEVTLSSAYIYDQNSGNTQGDIFVYINGQKIERKIAGINDYVGNVIFEEDVSGTKIYIYQIVSGPATQELSGSVLIECCKVNYTVASLDSISSDLVSTISNYFNIGNLAFFWKRAYVASSVTKDVVISALNIDWSLSNTFTKSISATSTFTFSNLPSSGNSQTIIVIVTNTSGTDRTVNFPAGIKWPGSFPVTTVLANKSVIYTFICVQSVVYAVSAEGMG
jgi:hypothetical protein